jgi:glycosyltransferase involved in cell wall biosynthesis
VTVATAASGSVVVDLRGAQGAGIDRSSTSPYARDFAMALERHRPDLVGRYLVASEQPVSDNHAVSDDLAELRATGKVVPASHPGAIPDTARVFHSMWALDISRPMTDIWPAEVEHLGLAYSATVHDLTRLRPTQYASDRRLARRYRARSQLLRQADAVLTPAPTTRLDVIDLAGVDPAAVTVTGSGEPWEEVAGCAAEVFERLAARGRRPWRTAPRLAFVSPFPPIASGVARYSYRLLEALAVELDSVAPGATIDCFADGLDRVAEDPVLPAGPREVFDARWFGQAELAVGGYDEILYVLGNSEFHAGALAALRHRNGIVMAHDVRLTGLLRHSTDRPGAVPGGLEGAIRRAYGDRLPDGLGRDNVIDEADIERFGLLLLRDIVPHADRLLVSSEAARQLAAEDAGPDFAGRVSTVPFAVALEKPELAIVATARSGGAADRRLIASFGIVDPSKLPHLLLEAFATPEIERDVELAFVGPVSDSLAQELNARAAELGMGDRMRVTGHLDRATYLAYLGRATVAVQLRAGFFGEASAAGGDCLAAGVATIVSDVGWMGTLPDDTVVKVRRSAGKAAVGELSDALWSLLDDPDRRAALAGRAAEFAGRQTFAQTATALVASLELAPSNG